MEENNVVADNSNTAGEVTPEVTTVSGEEPVVVEESLEEVKARLQKAEELANNYKIRAEKAEKSAKPAHIVEKKQEQKGNLSSRDLIALMEAKVHSDDVDEVEDFAKFKGISIAEALKSSTLKSILNEKTEQRNTAAATVTSTTRRPNISISDDTLVENARKGKFVESDDEIQRLMKAKLLEEKGKK